jgi:ketosteroid isomerase-like protein
MVKLQEDTSAIASAAQEFYSALHDLFQGDTYLGPQGGILVGWDQVSQAWKKQAQLKLQGKLTQQNIHIIQENNIGIMQCNEIGTNLVHGKTEQVRIRALNIFRKENGKWKMISHQTDLLPFLRGFCKTSVDFCS